MPTAIKNLKEYLKLKLLIVLVFIWILRWMHADFIAAIIKSSFVYLISYVGSLVSIKISSGHIPPWDAKKPIL